MFPGNGKLETQLLLPLLLLGLAGCRQDMADQPRYDALESSDFFANGMASRPVVEGTVARGQLRIDDHYYTGMVDGQPVTELPSPVTRELLERGQQRFHIYCAHCHGRLGGGAGGAEKWKDQVGMVVKRGFPSPPTFHTVALREAPAGRIFDVITNGYGRMAAHAELVPVADRWAIVAYIRTLQLSQHAMQDQLSPADLEQLNTTE